MMFPLVLMLVSVSSSLGNPVVNSGSSTEEDSYEVDCPYLVLCAKYLNFDVKGLHNETMFIPRDILREQTRSTACLNESVTTETLSTMATGLFIKEIYKCLDTVINGDCEKICFAKADKYTVSDFFGSPFRMMLYNRCIRKCNLTPSSTTTTTTTTGVTFPITTITPRDL